MFVVKQGSNFSSKIFFRKYFRNLLIRELIVNEFINKLFTVASLHWLHFTTCCSRFQEMSIMAEQTRQVTIGKPRSSFEDVYGGGSSSGPMDDVVVCCCCNAPPLMQYKLKISLFLSDYEKHFFFLLHYCCCIHTVHWIIIAFIYTYRLYIVIIKKLSSDNEMWLNSGSFTLFFGWVKNNLERKVWYERTSMKFNVIVYTRQKLCVNIIMRFEEHFFLPALSTSTCDWFSLFFSNGCFSSIFNNGTYT
jgi:hypothetical protein